MQFRFRQQCSLSQSHLSTFQSNENKNYSISLQNLCKLVSPPRLPRSLTQAIIGGVVAKHYPFFVLIKTVNSRCGGTLISRDSVLTAAHCLFNRPEQRWMKYEEVFVIRSNFTNPD